MQGLGKANGDGDLQVCSLQMRACQVFANLPNCALRRGDRPVWSPKLPKGAAMKDILEQLEARRDVARLGGGVRRIEDRKSVV